MKKILYILPIFILAFVGTTTAQNELTHYLKTAAENNTGLKVKFNEYMAALEIVPQVGTLPDPTVAFGYFIPRTGAGSQQAEISASQMFPWFGTLSKRKNTVEALAKAKYKVFEESKSMLFYDVKSTYYNLYFIHKAIDITLENISILNSLKDVANIKVESGLASAVDVYRVQMEINDLENQLAQLKNNVQELTVEFNTFLNVESSSNIHIAERLMSQTLLNKHEVLDSILKNNNTLGAFNYELEGLQHRQKLASKEGLPQLDLGFGYTFIDKGGSATPNSGRDVIMFPKIGITIPLYQNKYKSKVQEVVYLHEAKMNEKANTENTIRILFENIWSDYQDAIRRSLLYERQTELAEKTLSILESEYATNNVNFEELLRMERKLLKYALEIQKATVDKEASVAFMEYLQGQ